MGNNCDCCKSDENLTNFTNIDEFYNPFHLFNKNMVFDRNKI